ncbi:MAG TPA: PASTA domain-containing protein, partial [Clostridia bacterium]|nr:PASTA domain-containing protein [Clostridia bacterium]
TYTPDKEVQVKVPNVVGKSIDESADSFNWAGLNLRISGLGSAVSQNPAAGTMAPKGTIVQVEFMTPASD